MLKKTRGGGFEETEGGEKRDEAKVREFARLLEAVHRLVDAKDDVVKALPEGVFWRKGRRLRWERTAEEN